MTAGPKGRDPGDAGLVFAAHNHHDERCGSPPRLRNTDNPGLYYGYFENRYGEQFVFTFDRATGTGTVSGGDLGWGDPRPFSLEQLEETVSDVVDRKNALEAAGKVRTETSGLPTIDAALVLGGITSLSGKDEVIWLRACLKACATFAERPEDHRPT